MVDGTGRHDGSSRDGSSRDGRPLGVAVIGTNFGCLTHVRALRAAGFEVVALVGRDRDRTAARAERFGIPHALTSVPEAVARADIDAVTIATPPHTHGPIALAAIAAGKHVLCEKPLARDVAEARTMLSAAEAAGVVHLLGAEFRFGTGQALAARAIAGGAIGVPRLATFLLTIPLLADAAGQVPAWWSDADAGGGWLVAHGSHLIDQIRSTFGAIEGVSAGLSNLVDRPWSAEDTYTLHIRTVSGVEAVLQSSAATWGPILMITRFSGTEGTIWLEGDTVRLADAAGTRTLDVPDDLRTAPADPPPSDLMHTAYDLLHATGIDLGPYTRLAEAFRDRILGRPVTASPQPATFADGLATMVVTDAVRRSARGAGWVTL